MNVLTYKGYSSVIEFDAERLLLKGKVLHINESIEFQSKQIDELEKQFHQAVDEYLKRCEEKGIKPYKEYRGTFNVRIDPTLHAKMVFLASKEGISLNATVEKAIRDYVENQI